jgi:hypothetical protein
LNLSGALCKNPQPALVLKLWPHEIKENGFNDVGPLAQSENLIPAQSLMSGLGQNSPKHLRVFISYSHDSPEHRRRARALADQLRTDGIESWIDQYVQDPNEGWIRWMRQQVKQADKVLLIFTEAYQRRFEGDEEEGKGLGATFEGVIVTQALYEGGGSNAKFRPVVFEGADERFIPLELRRFNRYRVDTPEQYQNLLRWLYEAPSIVAPTIGQKPDLPAEPASELFSRKPVIGIENDRAIMEAVIKIDVVTEKRSGLTHVFNVFLRNVGGRSADDLRISINHSETACVAWQADDHRWVDIGHGTLNPRSLAARESIHPGENVLALAIPIVQATPFPFVVAVKAWIRDGEPREQHLIVEAPSLRAGELRPFAPGRGPDIRPPSEVIPDPVLAYPEDEMAEALLSVIARHPKPDEYGITEILAGDPADLTRALYMPSLARGGDTFGMDVALFQRALDWLVNTGWLEPAGQTSKVRLYRLGAHARGDQRFKELVNRETASNE